MEMRLVDAVVLASKITDAKKKLEKKSDERAVKALAYVLELIDDAPAIPVTPDADRMKRKRYGTNRKVLLSDDELHRLRAEFPTDADERIERLDEYIAQFGNKYKSHYATIRNWARREAREIEQKEKSFDTDEFLNLALNKTYGRSKGG